MMPIYAICLNASLIAVLSVISRLPDVGLTIRSYEINRGQECILQVRG